MINTNIDNINTNTCIHICIERERNVIHIYVYDNTTSNNRSPCAATVVLRGLWSLRRVGHVDPMCVQLVVNRLRVKRMSRGFDRHEPIQTCARCLICTCKHGENCILSPTDKHGCDWWCLLQSLPRHVLRIDYHKYADDIPCIPFTITVHRRYIIS